MFDWLYTAISWVLKMWHSLFSSFLPPAAGLTWALSIVFLVITVRILLFRLFVKQVRSQRAMQELQPEIAKLKKQYGSDRQGMAQAMQALQKERGVNPLAGCLPILPQIPVFIGLLHVLRRLRPGAQGLYGWDEQLTDQAASAKVFGAPISSAFFMTAGAKTDSILALPAELSTIRIVTTILIVVMCLTTFFTQKQIMSRSGPVEGQAAMIQKLLLYGMPIGLFVSSFFFPLGVLMYWFVNNLWTLAQQFYILKKLPPPGSAGALARAEAERPKIDPKELAPKPGVKPVRGPKGRTPVVNAATAAELSDGDDDGSGDSEVSAQPGGAEDGKRASAATQSATVGAPARPPRGVFARLSAKLVDAAASTGAPSTDAASTDSKAAGNGTAARNGPAGKASGTDGEKAPSSGEAASNGSVTKRSAAGNASPNGTSAAADSAKTGSATAGPSASTTPTAKPKSSAAKAGSGARSGNRSGSTKNRRKKR